jgi:hypothetical protein
MSEAIHWMEIAGAAIDGLLVGRVLMLRLQRVYVFITLACVLTVLFDCVTLWQGTASQASLRVFLYSRFIYALVFPLAAFDVFEEVKAGTGKLRRFALTKLISGLFFATLFGFIMSLFVQSDNSGEPVVLTTLALGLWAGSSSATLAFLWTLHRGMSLQHIERPRNTHVWLVFWALSLIGEVLSCFYFVVGSFIKNNMAADVVNMIFLVYGIAVTAWCIVMLRGLPSPVQSEPAADQS